MVKVLTAVRLSSIFRQTLATVALALLVLPASTIAAPYGSDGYGDCEFGDGCAAETTTDEIATDTVTVLNTFESFFTTSGTNIADLVVGDRVDFCINTTSILQVCGATEDTRYAANLKSINLSIGSVVMTIASTQADYTLFLNTPLRIDIDNNGSDDLELTLTGLLGTTADITFRNLGITISAPPSDIITTDEVAPKTAKSSDLSWLWWSLSSTGVLALLAIIWAIIKKRGGGGGTGYGSGPMGDFTSGGDPSNMSSSNSSAPTTFTPENYVISTQEMNKGY